MKRVTINLIELSDLHEVVHGVVFEVAQALQETLITEMDRRFKEYDQKMEKRFQKIDERFERIDRRFDRLEQTITHHDVLLHNHEKRSTTL